MVTVMVTVIVPDAKLIDALAMFLADVAVTGP